MQKQPELVGSGLGAGGPIGSQVRLPRLDVVLRRAAPAIHVLIEHTRVSARQARDNEAGVCSIGPGHERRLEIAQGQTPFAVLVSCSDSRVPPELLLGRGLGELFIVRGSMQIYGGWLPVELGFGLTERGWAG